MPFYLVYDREAILLIKMKYLTWRTLGQNDIRTHKELLVVRARQFEMRDEDILEVIAKQTRKRQEGQEYWDETHNIRKEQYVRFPDNWGGEDSDEEAQL